MRSEEFFICTHGACTIFSHGEVENITFATGQEKISIALVILVYILARHV